MKVLMTEWSDINYEGCKVLKPLDNSNFLYRSDINYEGCKELDKRTKRYRRPQVRY